MSKYLPRSRDIAAGDCYQFLAFGGKYSGNNALDRDICDAEDTPTYGSLLSSMSRLHFLFSSRFRLPCHARRRVWAKRSTALVGWRSQRRSMVTMKAAISPSIAPPKIS